MNLKANSIILGALCAAPIVWGQDPLDTWSTSSIGTQNPIYAIAFGNGQFVAVGGSGTIVSSPDGVAWTQHSIASPGAAYVVWGDGQFLALGPGGLVGISPDGINWTQHNSGPTNTLAALGYGSGQYVTVGFDRNGGVIISSSDSTNWVRRVSSANTADVPPGFVNVAHGNGFFVALGGGGDNPVATSTDGINWTITPNVGLYSPGGQPAMTFGNGLFVATAAGWTNVNGFMASSAAIFTSPDGLNWVARAQSVGGGNEFFSDVAYGEGQFVVVGPLIGDVNAPTGLPRTFFNSGDGTNWVEHDVSFGLSAVSFGNGRFVGLAGGSAWQSGVIDKLGARLSPTGGVQGTISGVTGQDYAIQASTNSSTWGLLTNVTVNTNGLAQFSDPAGRTFPQRFYRALLTPP